jgi:hypothetical protein
MDDSDKPYFCGNVKINDAEHFNQRQYESCKGSARDFCWKFIKINNDGTKTEMS